MTEYDPAQNARDSYALAISELRKRKEAESGMAQDVADTALVEQPKTAGFYPDGYGGATLTIVYEGQLARIPRTKNQLLAMAASALDLATRMKDEP